MDVPASSGCTDWEGKKGWTVLVFVIGLIPPLGRVLVLGEGCGFIADGQARDDEPLEDPP